MGRPQIGKARKVVIPEKVLDDLALIAAHRGEPVSEVIRTGLADYTRRVLKRHRSAA